MTNPKQQIKDRLGIPEDWKLEADWGKGEVSENIEFRQIGGRFAVTVADTSAIMSGEWETDEETFEVEEAFIVTMGILPAHEQFMGDLTSYVMVHAVPIGTGTGEDIVNGEELEITFNHFISVADAMQSLMSLLEL